jgi:hypothetical protein
MLETRLKEFQVQSLPAGEDRQTSFTFHRAVSSGPLTAASLCTVLLTPDPCFYKGMFWIHYVSL